MMGTMDELDRGFEIEALECLSWAEGRVHMRLELCNSTSRCQTWSLVAAFSEEWLDVRALPKYQEALEAPWSGGFQLGPVTLYPEQKKSIDVLARGRFLPPSASRLFFYSRWRMDEQKGPVCWVPLDLPRFT